MKRRVADIVMDTLVENNITTCFGVVGGGAMHLNNALFHCSQIKKVFNHHEQASAMAAEAYARYSGKPAAVCVTSGPGGTNTINGVQGAWADSLPMIVISGFPRWETSALESGLDIRTRGVQENDIISMVRGITKYAKRILNPLDIKAEVQHALDTSMEGRRGPVWIDIPLDIQGMLVEENDLTEAIYKVESEYAAWSLAEFEKMLCESERPCILTGTGIRTSGSIELFRDFIAKIPIPIVGGWQQGDICFSGQRNYYGTSGSPGPRAGNFILQNADLILVLGNSLSYYQTGFNQEAFAPSAKMIMVDAQADESKKSGLHVDMMIHSDLKEFFRIIEASEITVDASSRWLEYCNEVYTRFDAYELLKNESFAEDDSIPQAIFWDCFYDRAPADATVALGNSGCVAGALYKGVRHPDQRVLINYKCGSMGHDLPNAIGTAFASGKTVFCVTGDGSIMMNLQELQTIVQYSLPIKIALFSNNGYSAIRNTCSRFFNGEYIGCDKDTGVSFPDFRMIADAFGFPYKKCDTLAELDTAMNWYLGNESYCILEVRMDEIGVVSVQSTMDENGVFCTPALHIMSPLLSENEMKKWMPEW